MKISRLIELDELLNGSPQWEEVCYFFENGEFYEEYYLVEAIERWLLTEEQRKQMYDNKISIEKMLNGRCANPQIVQAIYKEWNDKLGDKHFGN